MRRTLSHAVRLWGTRAVPVVNDERAAVIAFLMTSAARKEAHIQHQDTSSQRRISRGQVALLRALARDIGAGAHILPDATPAAEPDT